jgi:hypothetical protein
MRSPYPTLRLRHAETTADSLPVDTPEREHARAVIVAEVLHWRIWNGKDAQITLEHIRAVMPAFRGEQGGRKRDPSSRRLWTALREIDRYLTSQSAWLVNYAERHRAGLRVGTALTEGTANFLVNRRMNKSQQGPATAPISCSSALSSMANSAPASASSSKLKPIPAAKRLWLLDPQSRGTPIPGSGPHGAICRNCSSLVTSGKKTTCGKFRTLTGRRGKPIDEHSAACRYYQHRSALNAMPQEG